MSLWVCLVSLRAFFLDRKQEQPLDGSEMLLPPRVWKGDRRTCSNLVEFFEIAPDPRVCTRKPFP